MLHRHSIRLKGYDYTNPGSYFITICSLNREAIFGHIVDQRIVLNCWGIIVSEEWSRTFNMRPGLRSEAFIIMPNHVHGIITIMGNTKIKHANPKPTAILTESADAGRRGMVHPCRGTVHRAPTMSNGMEFEPLPENPDVQFSPLSPHKFGKHAEQFGKPISGSIPTIIRFFKSAVTKRINELPGASGIKVWQRNYYEHIIRTETALNQISKYINENPLKWPTDPFYSG